MKKKTTIIISAMALCLLCSCGGVTSAESVSSKLSSYPSKEELSSGLCAVIYDNAPFTAYFSTDESNRNEELVFSESYSATIDSFKVYDDTDFVFDSYALSDIDSDGNAELIYLIKHPESYASFYVVFHEDSQAVSAYCFSDRLFYIYDDNSISASFAASSGVDYFITSFDEESVKLDVILSMDGDDFTVRGESVPEETYRNELDSLNSSRNPMPMITAK